MIWLYFAAVLAVVFILAACWSPIATAQVRQFKDDVQKLVEERRLKREFNALLKQQQQLDAAWDRHWIARQIWEDRFRRPLVTPNTYQTPLGVSFRPSPWVMSLPGPQPAVLSPRWEKEVPFVEPSPGPAMPLPRPQLPAPGPAIPLPGPTMPVPGGPQQSLPGPTMPVVTPPGPGLRTRPELFLPGKAIVVPPDIERSLLVPPHVSWWRLLDDEEQQEWLQRHLHDYYAHRQRVLFRQAG